MKIEKFSNEIIDELQYYVYKLIDPRNGKVFYIGKGKGNRIFDHAKGALLDLEMEKWQDELTEKMKTIREIKEEGLDVIYIIHRHHLDEATALEVEAALIDEYPGLTNVMPPINSEYGVTSVEQIVHRYGLEKITKFDENDKVLIIKIKPESVDDFGRGSIYDTVRMWWKLSEERIKEVKQVAAVINGVVKKVYKVEKWMYNDELKRYGFEGEEIKDSIYLNKIIPDEYKRRGEASPTLYTFKR